MVRELPDGFLTVAVLSLPRLLLHLLIRDRKPNPTTAHDDPESVGIGQIVFEVDRDL